MILLILLQLNIVSQKLSIGVDMSNASLLVTLGYIQEIIKRMAANSLFIKGWCISLTGVVIALGKKDYSGDFLAQVFLGVIVINVLFSVLDCYYLKQERIFRNEYNRKVRMVTNEIEREELTIISTKEVKTGFFSVYFSVSVIPFYALLILVGYFIARECL